MTNDKKNGKPFGFRFFVFDFFFTLRSTLYALRFKLDYNFCLLSAVLLILSHPPYNCWFLAWIALVPFFFAVEGKSFWQSFRRGYFFGLVYFFGMMWWLLHVTLPGMVILNMYLALYAALFASTYSFFSKTKLGFKILVTTCAWVAWEFARSRILFGFGWVCLGHTQYTQIWLIQIAKLVGVFGVSFVLIVFNQVVYYVIRYWKQRKENRHLLGLLCFTIGVMVLGIWAYGFWEITAFRPVAGRDALRIAVIQPNIAQQDKWNPFKHQDILDKLIVLTQEATKQAPDLIVWPESSVPAFPEKVDVPLKAIQHLAQKIRLPILLGYVRKYQERYYNTAGLISAQGRIVQQYDKLFLVPFGEFVPLRKQLPFLSKVVPIEDMSAGNEKTVFRLNKGDQERRFSVLICFEDTLDYAAQKFSNYGAEFFVNITNDAWFGDTKAPWLHAQSAVFQAVGYGRFLVRAANTGVSAVIAPTGKINKVFRTHDGRATFRRGFEVFDVFARKRQTVLAQFGNIFAYLCIACLCLGAIIKKIVI